MARTHLQAQIDKGCVELTEVRWSTRLQLGKVADADVHDKEQPLLRSSTRSQSACSDERRKAREAVREAENRRALELLAMTRLYSSDPGVVVVQGRWMAFKRNAHTAAMRRRKRERWR
jgi:hypothetical protein